MYAWPMAIDDFEASSGMLLWNKEGTRERIREICYGRPLLEGVAEWDGDIPLPDEVSVELACLQAQEWKYELRGNEDYLNLIETYKMFQSPPTGLQEKIVLMDRIIHAQHIGGSIWEDVDVEGLRSRVEAVSRRARIGEA